MLSKLIASEVNMNQNEEDNWGGGREGGSDNYFFYKMGRNS